MGSHPARAGLAADACLQLVPLATGVRASLHSTGREKATGQAASTGWVVCESTV
jgi:hypothetical protein